ncbi:MAG: hypothetical protein AB2L20_12515 [Mangrovibacterium sp.]
MLMIALALMTFSSFGQTQHLEPTRDFKQCKGILKDYYDSLFPLLYRGYSEKPSARYTSLPSFSNEYAFSVETIAGKACVVSNSLSESYWYAEERGRVNLTSNKSELSNDLYLKILDLFKLLDQQTKVPEDVEMGTDGTTYYFATTNKSGEVKIASPTDRSVSGKTSNSNLKSENT